VGRHRRRDATLLLAILGNVAAARNVGNVGLLEPSVVMAQDGTVTVAWSQWVNGFYNVWTMEGTVSGAWTAPMALRDR